MFDAALMAATLSCALVAGLVLGFAVVVMPGLATLPEREFLQAFKRMDKVIQNNQPVFMIVWVGSIVSVLLMVAGSHGASEGGVPWDPTLTLTRALEARRPGWRVDLASRDDDGHQGP